MTDQAAKVAPAAAEKNESTQGLVLKNAFLLAAAQVLATPLSVLVNAVLARHLGASDFGSIYLASTMCAFGFLLVDWGQPGTLPALIARDRSRAGEIVGTGLVWRLGAALVVYAGLAVAAALLYPPGFGSVLALVLLGYLVGDLATAGQDAIRGFERTDVAAYAVVGLPLLNALIVVPVLLLGGRLHAALTAQIVANAIIFVFVWRAFRTIRAGSLSFRYETLKALITQGFPFLMLGLTMVLQPNVDAVFLSKLAPIEVVGWHAAAKKLVGMLVFPVSALISALYPTLCRLWVEDREGYNRTARTGLRTAVVLVCPAAIGCFLFPDLGILIFSKASFGPAEDNLRILSLFVLLLYFSMTLGSSLIAAGRQREWAVTQSLCVVVSVVADPLLIPWFQRRTGNGGLGVCVATVLSEVLMVVAGVILAPKGLLDRGLYKGLALACVAGAAMAVCARVLGGVSHFVAAPVSVLVYVGCLWAIGGFAEDLVQLFKGAVARKFSRWSGARR
jgi:O-antigen/teichoic acid export membrane protein